MKNCIIRLAEERDVERLVSIARSNNAVSGEFRGMGIAPRMYEFIFELLRSKGALAVRVTTGLDDAHAPARRAYEKAGFSANLPSVTYYKKL